MYHSFLVCFVKNSETQHTVTTVVRVGGWCVNSLHLGMSNNISTAAEQKIIFKLNENSRFHWDSAELLTNINSELYICDHLTPRDADGNTIASLFPNRSCLLNSSDNDTLIIHCKVESS